MRADRLLSILMLLQAHGKMSAPQLSKELEVSVRSIYRDMDALSAAGVPVYVERGVNGGCLLLEGYRNNLTGLTREEVKALFMLGIPASLDELGVSQEVKSALRKLTASLPAVRCQDEKTVYQRVYVDWSDWSGSREPKPCLQSIYQAVHDNCELHLTYTEMIGPLVEQFERTVNPYGLVARSGEWYLVCASGNRTYVYRISRILKAETTGMHFEYPPDFNLITTWKAWWSEQQTCLPIYTTKIRISPYLARYVSGGNEERLYEAMSREKTVENDGSVIIDLSFETFREARTYILGLGNAIKVLGPESLRLSVIDHAKQVLNLYSQA
jgi:predicted DNA-binding transcriptional regulator YafY